MAELRHSKKFSAEGNLMSNKNSKQPNSWIIFVIFLMALVVGLIISLVITLAMLFFKGVSYTLVFATLFTSYCSWLITISKPRHFDINSLGVLLVVLFFTGIVFSYVPLSLTITFGLQNFCFSFSLVFATILTYLVSTGKLK